jgi:glycosyltransferase involved in cell wall biosynthesis
MKVEIFTIVKNGQYILPHYLKHYKKCFPGCVINIFDNNSIDDSVRICRQAGAIIKNFPKFTVALEQQHKNSVWKKSKADWVIVCDQDELVQITSQDLELLPQDINVIKFKGYNMLDIRNENKPELFNYGFHSPTYDKCLMFKPTLLGIEFSIGSHFATPHPNPVCLKDVYKMFHYNKSWFTLNAFIAKHPGASVKDLTTVYNIGLKDKINL